MKIKNVDLIVAIEALQNPAHKQEKPTYSRGR